MTLPEIPTEVQHEGYCQGEAECICAVGPAWPVMYKAALRLAADHLSDVGSGDSDWWYCDFLRGMADEATA